MTSTENSKRLVTIMCNGCAHTNTQRGSAKPKPCPHCGSRIILWAR